MPLPKRNSLALLCLMLACCRGMYSLAARGQGPAPKMFSQVDPVTNMPTNSAIFGLFISILWLVYFYGGCLMGNWFGPFCFDSSELPIITLYALYIPIYFALMKQKALPTFKRNVMPILATICSLFMVFAAIYSHKMNVVFYLIVFVVVMVIGTFFRGKKDA